MVSAIELINALTCMLRENFPNVKIEDRDIEEGFDRPSFFIDISEIKSAKTGEMYNDLQEVKIYYFATCRKTGYLECLKIKNKLRYLLADNIRLPCNEAFVFAFEEIEYHVNKKDKTILAEGSILFVQEEDRPDNTPEVEELVFNLSTGNTCVPIEQGTVENNEEENKEDFIQKV